jgi:hypothetical protein
VIVLARANSNLTDPFSVIFRVCRLVKVLYGKKKKSKGIPVTGCGSP